MPMVQYRYKTSVQRRPSWPLATVRAIGKQPLPVECGQMTVIRGCGRGPRKGHMALIRFQLYSPPHSREQSAAQREGNRKHKGEERLDRRSQVKRNAAKAKDVVRAEQLQFKQHE